MPVTPTYIPLGTITLASTEADIDFSSIPATYRDLILVCTLTSNINTDVDFRFNGNTSSVYSVVIMSGDGSSTFSPTYGDTYMRPTYYGGARTTPSNNMIIQIMDYAQTDKHKTVLSRSNNANTGTDATSGRFASTDAITSIKVFNASGRQFVAGSTVSLFGVN